MKIVRSVVPQYNTRKDQTNNKSLKKGNKIRAFAISSKVYAEMNKLVSGSEY